MEWYWEVGKLVLAAGMGFGGGRVAVLLDRRHKKKEENLAKEADWVVEWMAGDTWVLTNIGSADAADVLVEFEAFQLTRSRLQPEHPMSESQDFMGIRRGASQAVITWTNPRGDQKGPVRRLIPPRGS
ncbi:hypothetical protein [Arthrobacter sp. Bi83]|uniref:hypothetical protein n=1 Tax=Arthrobacter sp. Bi83 TaxID=2822353 RepID=UPI001E57AAEE|nr:hypothetical protein [Arthrobacter sp. Bi83]